MNYNVRAVIVRKTEWKESSFIIQSFSREYGYLSFIAHGLKKNNSPDRDNLQLYNEVELNLRKGPNADLFILQNSLLHNRFASQNKYQALVILSSVFELLQHIMINPEDIQKVYDYVIRFLSFFKEIDSNYLVYYARFSFILLSIINPHIMHVRCDVCHQFDQKIAGIDDEERFICDLCLRQLNNPKPIDLLDSNLKFVLYYQDSFWKMTDILQESTDFAIQFKKILNHQFYTHFHQSLHLKSLDLYLDTL